MSLPSSPTPSEPFLVGDFLVVPERNELRQLEEGTGLPNGEPLRLTSKQMDVLVALASKPGQPVSKNELFETVWPGVTVGEDNISSCIYELRKAFGSQAYIQTVRNRGYLLAPAVVRPLPARLLEALEPNRHESAEILLAGIEADGFRNVPTPPPEPPERLDHQIRRNLAIAFGALALLVVLGVLLIRNVGTFTVGLGKFANATGDASYDAVATSLSNSAWTYFDEGEETYYRVTEFLFLAGTKVTLEVSKAGSESIKLEARISDGEGGKSELVTVEGAPDSRGDLGIRLFQGIRRVLDTRACRMDTEVNMLKASHCLSAGLRQVKNRAWDDALSLLEEAEKFYSQLLTGEDSGKVARKLILVYDQLANLHDTQGRRDQANELLVKARRLLADPSLEFKPGGIDELRIRRRQAQIDEDVDTELALLELLRTKDSGAQEWRHSFGWFQFTHIRDCYYSEVQFTEAIDDPTTDPAIRATYHSYKGDIQLACRKLRPAIASYSEHIRLNPVEADPYEMRGVAYMTVGDYIAARTDLNKALELDGSLTSAILNKGNLEADLGHYQDAEREYQRALDDAGDASNQRRDVLIAWGRLALAQGQPQKAAKMAEQAVELKGGNQVQAYWLLGLAALAEGRTEEARTALAALEQHFSSTSSKYLREYFLHLRAQLLLAGGQGDAAIATLQEALDNYPSEPIYFLSAKAEAFARLGRDAEAFKAYQALLSINPNHRRSRCAAARLAEKLKSTEVEKLYALARDSLGDRCEDADCQSCLERARAFETTEEPPQ